MRASEAIPLDHSRDGNPEHCCSGGKHNFHFRPGAPRTPGDLIWCCCKSLLTEIEPEKTGPAFEYASEEVGEAFTEWCASSGNHPGGSMSRPGNPSLQGREDANEVSRYGHD